MFATIRRYTPKGGAGADIFSGLKERFEKGYLPTIQNVQGFHGYYMIKVSDRELVTISIFESRTGAEESTRRAAEFVKTDPLKDKVNPRRSSRASCWSARKR